MLCSAMMARRWAGVFAGLLPVVETRSSVNVLTRRMYRFIVALSHGG